MTRKLLWVASMVAVALMTVTVNRLFAARQGGASAAGTDSGAAERIARLEASLQALERAQSRTGAQAGAALAARLQAGAPTQGGANENTQPVVEDRATRLAREQREFQRFDELARTGNGTAFSAQLRKNLEEARKLPKERSPGDIDIKTVDCGATMCRIEVQHKGELATGVRAASFILGKGMGTLTMQPFSPDKPAVYYVMAPGLNLPTQN